MRIGQQATGTLQQHPELGRSAGRADMLDDPLPPPAAYSAICTAVAPEAVRTFRMNATPRPDGPPLSA